MLCRPVHVLFSSLDPFLALSSPLLPLPFPFSFVLSLSSLYFPLLSFLLLPSSHLSSLLIYPLFLPSAHIRSSPTRSLSLSFPSFPFRPFRPLFRSLKLGIWSSFRFCSDSAIKVSSFLKIQLSHRYHLRPPAIQVRKRLRHCGVPVIFGAVIQMSCPSILTCDVTLSRRAISCFAFSPVHMRSVP